MIDIGIVVPIKNRASELADCLKSIQDQSFKNFECLLVDDGSDAETVDLQKRFSIKDSRFKMISRPAGKSGGSVCRNAGLARLSAPWVVFLDSDDLLAQHALRDRFTSSKSNTSVVSVSNAEAFQETPGDSRLLFNVPTRKANIDRFLALDYPWQTAGPTWPTDMLLSLGGFDESLPSWQDWELFIRACANGIQFDVRGCCDFYFRINGNDKISSRQRSDKMHLAAGIKLMSRIEDLLGKKGLLDDSRANKLEVRRRELLYYMITHHGLGAACSVISDFPSPRRKRVIIRSVLCKVSMVLPKHLQHQFRNIIWPGLFDVADVNLFLKACAPELLASNKP